MIHLYLLPPEILGTVAIVGAANQLRKEWLRDRKAKRSKQSRGMLERNPGIIGIWRIRHK